MATLRQASENWVENEFATLKARVDNASASVTKSGSVATISIKDTNGSTTTATVSDGTDGEDGVGVPAGGTTGQVLKKKSGTNYDTEWGDGGGGGEPDAYVKEASVASEKLTLTKKDGTTVELDVSGKANKPDVIDAGLAALDANGNLESTNLTIDWTLSENNLKVPTSSAVSTVTSNRLEKMSPNNNNLIVQWGEYDSQTALKVEGYDRTQTALATTGGIRVADGMLLSTDSGLSKLTITDWMGVTSSLTPDNSDVLTKTLGDSYYATPASVAAKQDKIYTTSSTATFTAPSTVTVTSGSESKTLTAEYSGLALVDGDWTCTAYLEGDGVSEDVEFSTSDGGHTEAETSVNFGTQSFSIVIDQTTFAGSVSISATRTSTTSYCGAEADKTPTEDSNKLVTSGGVYEAVENAVAADVTHAKSISVTGVSTPCEPDEDGDIDVSTLFSSSNTSLTSVIQTKIDATVGTINTALDTINGEVA